MISAYNASSGIFLEISKKKGFFDPRFITNWPEIVGEELALKCLPAKMVFDKQSDERVLFVYSKDASFKAMFTYYKEAILNKVSLYFGISSVTNVKLINIK